MELEHIKAKNFQSFKEISYDFENGEVVLIQGENLTDNNQESNGSGKSALITIAEYCIMHLTSKNVNDKNLVFWWDGSDLAEMETSIHCPIRKETLLIERKIHLKTGGAAQLSVNGVIQYKFVDKMVDEIDKFILEWIGITKEDLQNFFILSKFKYVSFYKASNTAITQLIGRFSNSNIIAGIDKDILAEAQETENKRILLTDEKNRLYGMIDVHKTNLDAERTIDKEKLVQEKLEAIDDLIIDEGDKIIADQVTIGQQNDKIDKCNEELKGYIVKLDEANKKLIKLKEDGDQYDAKYEAIDNHVKEIKDDQEVIEGQLKDLGASKKEMLETLQEIELNIKGTVQCPKCKFEFIVSQEGIDPEKEREAKIESDEILAHLDKSIEAAKKSLEAFNPELKEIKAKKIKLEAEESVINTAKRNINSSITAVQKSQGDIDRDIKLCENEIIICRQNIKRSEEEAKRLTESKKLVTIDSFDNKEKIQAIEQLIIECEENIVVNETQDKKLNDQVFEIKQWAFTFKEFNQYLSVKTLKVLQGYANSFLEKMGSDLRLQLDGYKIKSDGSLSEKITPYIIRDGESKEFGNFSGGEKAKLEAAAILTFQYAINSTNKYGGLNFLSADEIFESLDGLGISTLASSLMNLGKTIILTTHIPVNNYECKSLKIKKENKVSFIANN